MFGAMERQVVPKRKKHASLLNATVEVLKAPEL